MIERYVFVRLQKEYSTDAGRAEVVARTRTDLAALPGVLSVTVGTPADAGSGKAWDIGIVVRFAAIEDVAPYGSHPDHRTYVDDFLAPRMEVIKAWNFVVD